MHAHLQRCKRPYSSALLQLRFVRAAVLWHGHLKVADVFLERTKCMMKGTDEICASLTELSIINIFMRPSNVLRERHQEG